MGLEVLDDREEAGAAEALRELREALGRGGEGKLAVSVGEDGAALHLTKAQAEGASVRLRAAVRRGVTSLVVPGAAIAGAEREPALEAVVLSALQPCAEAKELLLRHPAAAYRIAQSLKLYNVLNTIRSNVGGFSLKCLAELAMQRDFALLTTAVIKFTALAYHSNSRPDICAEMKLWELENLPVWDALFHRVTAEQEAQCQTEADFLLADKTLDLVTLWTERFFPLQEGCRWCRSWETAVAKALLHSARLRPNESCGFILPLMTFCHWVQLDWPSEPIQPDDVSCPLDVPVQPESVERLWRAVKAVGEALVERIWAERPAGPFANEDANSLFAVAYLASGMVRSRTIARPLDLAMRAAEVLEAKYLKSQHARNAFRELVRCIDERPGPGCDHRVDALLNKHRNLIA